MTDFAKLARPYAKAAFEYAQAQQQLPRWSKMLATMTVYINDPAVVRFLRDPKYSAQQHGELGLTLGEQVLDTAGQNFIKILASNGRLALMPYIAQLFDQFRAAAEKTLTAHIKSVIPLTEQEQNQLRELLNKRFACQVMPVYEIDPELLGGLLIHAGDCVIDGSIRGQLQRMREALIS